MKIIRKIIEIDEEKCDGCGNCVVACAEGAIEIIDGKAKVIADKYCDGLGACIGDCPQDALHIVEREADEFDEEAVEELLASQKKAPTGGCPSAAMKTFAPMAGGECDCANQPQSVACSSQSALGHWPVQLRLVPPGAPFLKNADLLISADCVSVAHPNFHGELLKDKAVMIGCPKFDDAQMYVEKLTQVFKQSGIRSITCAIMEVPCCSGLPSIVRKALEASGMEIPLTEIVISARGEKVDRGRLL
ncbi:MAG: 4Fe-4S dicluster domain-containing protein [Desulfovibrionales bacterium]|nr:4Fe-4S dicluster domain-containing protein [Desulfovibrionales bacterium]